MGRHLLMQSLLGHLELLKEKHPKKASSVVARRVRVAAQRTVNPTPREGLRKAA